MDDLMQQARELLAAEFAKDWQRGNCKMIADAIINGDELRGYGIPYALAAIAAALRAAPTGTDEYLAYLEAAVDEAGFVIKHDGGSLGNSNFRFEPKVPASPSIPLKVFSEGPWVFGETGQQFSGADLDGAAFAAYQQCNAPCAAPDGLIEQHARDSEELRRLCQSRDFYKRRCEALQAVQSSMRDPERKAVCDILANGETTVYAAARPQGVKDA